MTDVIRVGEYYIHAPAAQLDKQARVLKGGDSFCVVDHQGDMHAEGLGEQGLYHEGTRHLSRMTLRLGDRPFALLSSTVLEDNTLLVVDLSNPDLEAETGIVLPRGSVHVFRSSYLWEGVLRERLRLHNFSRRAIELELVFSFESDFRDIFEVRGSLRPKRGRLLAPEVDPEGVTLGYEGLDNVLRRTRLSWHPQPYSLNGEEARLRVHVEAGRDALVYMRASCVDVKTSCAPTDWENDLARFTRAVIEEARVECRVRSSNALFDRWLRRSTSDLQMMVTETQHGPYPYAGVPWYSTAFGRDGIITALQALWLRPELAKGVLRYLAATQARTQDAVRDAEPGKIFHETRLGEMAALGEIPFGLYYGTIDATPLFIVLAGETYRSTADRALAEALWPNVEAALAWMDHSGDLDGDGFLEYARRTDAGLHNQGWKDSHDAVFHADGRLAEGPIALCEVQAYAYAARRAGAMLARVLGHGERAATLEAQADALHERFNDAFWLEDLGTYALALDGRKVPCRVRSSNAGQCLFTGIVPSERAHLMAAQLMSPDFFSGWGIRTIAQGEALYNPMSYHNGSIWPHDDALIALGLARCGHAEEAVTLLGALFEAAQAFDLHRTPELFCGFVRRPHEGPVLYPVACAPQAWAAGAPLMLLQACLGMEVDAPARRLTFDRPRLPEQLDALELRGLQVGDAVVDVAVHRHRTDAGVDVLRRDGEVNVLVRH